MNSTKYEDHLVALFGGRGQHEHDPAGALLAHKLFQREWSDDFHLLFDSGAATGLCRQPIYNLLTVADFAATPCGLSVHFVCP